LKPAVLQLVDSFNQGGSERQALQLTRLLCESGRFRIYLASLSSEGYLRETITDLDIGDVPIFPLQSFYDRNAVQQLRRFRQLLKSLRIDIIHSHDFYTNVFGMAGAALARTPVRIASMRETMGMRSPAQKRVQRLAYTLSHQIIANSNAVRDKLIKDGIDRDKVTVVYNGLSLERLATNASRSEALSRLGLPAAAAQQRLISIVANMRHEVKDYPMFLRSAQHVKATVRDAAFLLAGEGELMESLRVLGSQLGLDDSLYFLGRCDHIAELLKISDICVLSSKAEGFSNSIIEYMAAGRPVVATNVGGASEAVVDGVTGFLVPSSDDRAMAEKLILLLQNPEHATEMGRQGRAIVQEKFSCAAQLESTERLYEKLLRVRN
jgi:L-malate glycosyltransferase